MSKLISGRKIGRKICSYDTSEIANAEVKYRMANKSEFDHTEEDTEEKIRERVYEDGFIFEDAINDINEIITKKMERNKKQCWKCEVINFGWQGKSGYKFFRADTGSKLLREILPKTECSYRVYNYGTKGFAVNNAHHDSPTWNEWYFIVPAKKKEME